LTGQGAAALVGFPGLVRAAAAAAALLVPALACAQEWGYRPGGSARIEFTDNYLLRAFDKQSATTYSVQPFITAYRRTETSQVNLLAGVGYNYVTGIPGDNDYWTGRLALDGAATFDRSLLGFNVSIARDNALVTETQQTGIVLGAGSVSTGSTAGLNYTYKLTERWSAGAFGSVYQNNYTTPSGSPTSLQNNSGYSAGGTLGYTLSPRTQLALTGTYAYYDSDITTNNTVTVQLAATHQYSEQLTVSGYGGYFWSKIDATQNVAVCPTTPTLCQLGLVQFVTIPGGSNDSSGDTLFGGTVSYAYSQRTSFSVDASQSITPSGTGTITKATNVNAYAYHNFSERLRGRVGGTWTRSTIPGFNTDSFQTTYYSVIAGGSYNLSDAWLLDFGVRRDHSDQRGVNADANVVFVSIGYNWPGTSMSSFSGLGGFTFPSASTGAGRPPEAIPGQPLGAQTPVPQSAAPAAEAVPE